MGTWFAMKPALLKYDCDTLETKGDSLSRASCALPENPAQSQDSGVQRMFAVLYGELRAIAQRELRRGGALFALGANTLLHELYLNLQSRRDVNFPDRGPFLAYASR